MNISDITRTDTSLHKFLDFCKSTDLEVIYHDWDNTCGIEVRKFDDVVIFNFYDDGSFRCMIDVTM